MFALLLIAHPVYSTRAVVDHAFHATLELFSAKDKLHDALLAGDHVSLSALHSFSQRVREAVDAHISISQYPLAERPRFDIIRYPGDSTANEAPLIDAQECIDLVEWLMSTAFSSSQRVIADLSTVNEALGALYVAQAEAKSVLASVSPTQLEWLEVKLAYLLKFTSFQVSVISIDQTTLAELSRPYALVERAKSRLNSRGGFSMAAEYIGSAVSFLKALEKLIIAKMVTLLPDLIPTMPALVLKVLESRRKQLEVSEGLVPRREATLDSVETLKVSLREQLGMIKVFIPLELILGKRLLTKWAEMLASKVESMLPSNIDAATFDELQSDFTELYVRLGLVLQESFSALQEFPHAIDVIVLVSTASKLATAHRRGAHRVWKGKYEIRSDLHSYIRLTALVEPVTAFLQSQWTLFEADGVSPKSKAEYELAHLPPSPLAADATVLPTWEDSRRSAFRLRSQQLRRMRKLLHLKSRDDEEEPGSD